MKRAAFLFAIIAIVAGVYAYIQFDTAKSTNQAEVPLPDGALVLVALPAILKEQETRAGDDGKARL